MRRKRCKFIDDQAGEEDENGREIRARGDDDDGDDAPNEEDLAFINDEEEECSSSDGKRVRISRSEKELTEDDLELIQANAGVISPTAPRRGRKRGFKRLERTKSGKVYKDSDEDDVHSSDEDFIESDSDSSADDSGSPESASPPPVRRRPAVSKGAFASLHSRVSEAIEKASDFFASDKFWQPEPERPATDESDQDEPRPPPAPDPPKAARPAAVIFQKGFKTSVVAPAKKPKPPAKKQPAKRAPAKRPEWDADQPGYVYNRKSGKLMYRRADGGLVEATGVDDF